MKPETIKVQRKDSLAAVIQFIWITVQLGKWNDEN